VCVGGVTALWWWATGRVGAGEAIPFVPFLAAGIVTAYFWRDAWAAWYGSLLAGSIFSSKTIYMW
jgi:prepilin signal peptidase PulO-like enzyme (type II secretory pathway)